MALKPSPVADPGFPRGGGANSLGGANIRFCQPNFPKNCMKLKEFGPSEGGGTRPKFYYVDPPLQSDVHNRGISEPGMCGGRGGMHGRYYEIQSMSGQYTSYWNACKRALSVRLYWGRSGVTCDGFIESNFVFILSSHENQRKDSLLLRVNGSWGFIYIGFNV